MDDLANIPGATLNRTYPAVGDSVGQARTELTAFARSSGATQEEIADISLAASEALTNAVIHAYGDRPGVVRLTAALADDELWVLVADDGRGLRIRSDRSGLGLGFPVMAQLSDSFVIAKRSTGGMEVRMGFKLASASSAGGHARGSLASASDAPSPSFSTTT